MSAEVVATIAVGAPATVIATAAYLSSRTKDQREAARQLFADLVAPLRERMDDVEEDVEELKRRERPHPS